MSVKPARRQKRSGVREGFTRGYNRKYPADKGPSVGGSLAALEKKLADIALGKNLI